MWLMPSRGALHTLGRPTTQCRRRSQPGWFPQSLRSTAPRFPSSSQPANAPRLSAPPKRDPAARASRHHSPSVHTERLAVALASLGSVSPPPRHRRRPPPPTVHQAVQGSSGAHPGCPSCRALVLVFALKRTCEPALGCSRRNSVDPPSTRRRNSAIRRGASRYDRTVRPPPDTSAPIPMSPSALSTRHGSPSPGRRYRDGVPNGLRPTAAAPSTYTALAATRHNIPALIRCIPSAYPHTVPFVTRFSYALRTVNRPPSYNASRTCNGYRHTARFPSSGRSYINCHSFHHHQSRANTFPPPVSTTGRVWPNTWRGDRRQ